MSVVQAPGQIARERRRHTTAIVQKLGSGGLRIQISEHRHRTRPRRSRTSSPRTWTSRPTRSTPQIVGPSWGEEISKRPAGPGHLPGPGGDLPGHRLRVADGARRAGRAASTTSPSPSASTRWSASRSRPGTVIGLLTILGYSLYDTVVVFDGLKEATKDITKQNRCTYSEVANRASTDPGAVDQHHGRRAAAGRRRCCSSAAACSARACSTTSRSRCSSASPPARTPRSSSPPRWSPTSRSASPQMKALRQAGARQARRRRRPRTRRPRTSRGRGLRGRRRRPERRHAGAGVGGQRRQPARSNRGRGRPSGKRR